MNIDDLARRFHGWIVVGFLAVAAYFQANGVVTLLSAELMAPHAAVSVAHLEPKERETAPANPNPGDPILARNAFDSATGPLDRNAIEVVLPPEPPKVVDVSNPLDAPQCTGITLHAASQSDDVDWSVANLRLSNEKRGVNRRLGDVVGDLRVVHIGYNARRDMPAVWLLNDKEFCQVLLFAPPPGGERAAPSEEPPPPPPPTPAATPHEDPRLIAMQRRNPISSSAELAELLKKNALVANR